MIFQEGKEYVFEKAIFIEKLKKLSKKVAKTTWDVAVKVALMQSQLSLAHGEIVALESLLASREARWEIVIQSLELQGELH